MAQEVKNGNCKFCGNVIVFRDKTNHWLHLVISIITFGFWLPIWLLCSIKIGGWKCSKCARTISLIP